MTDLAAKLEAAQPGQEREVLEELWEQAHDGRSVQWCAYYGWPEGGDKHAAYRFSDLLLHHGWLSAVEMLVPKGLAWTCGKNVHHGYWHASLNKLNEDGEPISVGCSNATATPALALAAAIARSLGHE